MAQRGVAARNTAWAFFGAFFLSCLLFWWLPGILFRFLGLEDPVESWALRISFLGIAMYAAGYLLPPIRFNMVFVPWLLDWCEAVAYRATIWLAFPALILGVRFFLSRSGVDYGQGEPLSLFHQAVFYGHMFFAFLFLGVARGIPKNRHKIIVASVAVIAPRLVVSLHWGRFFLVQGVVPVLLIALARGWLTLSTKRVLQFAALVLFVLFVPSFTRGDSFLGQDELVSFFEAGSTLRMLQDNRELNLAGMCPPLLVSMTDKLVPYGLLGVCTMQFKGAQGVPATLDRILTDNDPANEETLGGTGSNYLLELYLSGGIGAVTLGSLLFGFTGRCFVKWISERSLFAGIWAECLSRVLFAPRSTLGYVYERIPSLLVATLIIVGVGWFLYAPSSATTREPRGMRPSLPQGV
jgi:hypothetical protein